MALELDHVFVFVPAEDGAPDPAVVESLDALGLKPSYSRRHAGQGTANLCYCFDNAYLELLFVVDAAELARPDVARNGFTRRAFATEGASPFGIALRGGPVPGETWPYRIEAFPPGLSIPVSVESDDPRLPFLFGSPGTMPPTAWTDGRAGERQTAAGFSKLSVDRITIPSDTERPSVLDALVETGIIGSVQRSPDPPLMRLLLDDRIRLDLPAFTTG